MAECQSDRRRKHNLVYRHCILENVYYGVYYGDDIPQFIVEFIALLPENGFMGRDKILVWVCLSKVLQFSFSLFVVLSRVGGFALKMQEPCK